MSLFSSLQVASTSLRSTQIGLQVVGQNIANANTPGYIRTEAVFAAASPQQIGRLQLGLGVQVDGIVQQIDNLLEQRLRNSISDRAGAETEEQFFGQLEVITSELGGQGLSKSLADFVGSINDVLNQPESIPARNLAVLRGQTFAEHVNRLHEQASQLRTDIDNQLAAGVNDVNRLSRTIADLNVKIARAEGGNSVKTPAVGLRDQRNVALGELAELVDINVQEQPSGAVAVYCGGDFLVFGDEQRDIAWRNTPQGLTLQMADNSSRMQVTSGRLQGLQLARDGVVGNYLTDLDQFATALAYEFNKVHSSGQGLSGYQQITSGTAVSNTAAALDAVGLNGTPVNGSFLLHRIDKKTGIQQSTRIEVDLNGLDHDTTLADLATAIDALDDISATIDLQGRLNIKSASRDLDFAFGDDTSGLLAAMGINTFFSGTGAANLAVSNVLATDPGKLATSRNGVAEDTENGVLLAAFLDRPLESLDQNTILQFHNKIVGNVTERSAASRSVAEGSRVFESSLKGQSLSISGVNIDEEAIKMITLQRTFQASAKFLSTVNELLDVLINL